MKNNIILPFHLDVEIQFFDQDDRNAEELDREYPHDLLQQ